MREAAGRIRRVLMTCDTVGGVWTFALELAEGLAAHGVEVVLASLGGMPSREQKESAARANVCMVSADFKLEWMEDPWRDVANSGRWLRRLSREYSPDVIHLNSYGTSGLPFGHPVVLTAHSCVLSWWKAVRRTPIPPEWDRYRATVTYALNSAGAITAPSRSMAAALAAHYCFKKDKLRVIYNGRNPRHFRSQEKEPFVFVAGRLWDEAKNAAALAEIAPSLSWPVYMAGEGQVRGSQPMGRLSPDEMAEWYARAAIYALPARYEPFGLSALEAALSGCALVLGDISSLREIWGDAALFVPPDDKRALRAAIETMIADEGLRCEMARKGYARARRFGPRSMVRSYLSLYQAAVLRKSLCVS